MTQTFCFCEIKSKLHCFCIGFFFISSLICALTARVLAFNIYTYCNLAYINLSLPYINRLIDGPCGTRYGWVE